MTGTDPERRPIAARRLRAFQRMAQALASARVSADAISAAGMACGVAAGACLAATAHAPGAWWRLAFAGGAALVALRLLANMLDGMVAVSTGTATATGELWNEVPDRVSDVATLAGLGLSAGGDATWGLLAALAAVLTAYVRAAARVAGAPQDYRGPMAKPHRMAVVVAVALACAALPAGWTRALPGVHGLPALALVVVAAGSALTAARRLARAARVLRAAP